MEDTGLRERRVWRSGAWSVATGEHPASMGRKAALEALPDSMGEPSEHPELTGAWPAELTAAWSAELLAAWWAEFPAA